MRFDDFMKSERFYLSDGGLETYMVFEKGFDLPCFSAAVLLDSDEGRLALVAYFERFIGIARTSGRGFILDAPTWRAGAAWSKPMGQSIEETMEVNARAVLFAQQVRDAYDTPDSPILINGLVGPAGDAYAPDTVLSEQEAFDIHSSQVRALGRAGVDMISAMTLTHASEAIGIVRAAQEIDVPVAIAFTLETDGKLPSGQALRDAIMQVDEATNAYAAYFMINCAHPDHFRDVLQSEDWLKRIGGLRVNASRMSHAELDESEVLDDGDPVELGQLNSALVDMLPNLRVTGGCCGTDHRHVGCIAGHNSARAAA